MLRQRSEDPANSRYTSASAQKIIAMAGRLQDAASDHVVTVDEIEQIAREVGVRPEFVRQALETMRLQDVHIEEAQSRRATVTSAAPSHAPPRIDSIWWAVAWVLIPISAILGERISDNAGALGPFVYVGVGIFLSMIRRRSAPPPVSGQTEQSREALLEKLFDLQ